MRIHMTAAIVAVLAATAAPIASAQSSAPSAAAAQPAPSWSALKTYTGTIVQVDTGARLVTTDALLEELAAKVTA